MNIKPNSVIKREIPWRRKIQKPFTLFSSQRNFYLSSLLVFIVYLRPIFSQWVYSDEYHLFAKDSQPGEHMRKDGALFGQVIYNSVSRNLVSNPSDLWRLRILSFICFLMVLSAVSKKIYEKNPNPTLHFLIPISLLLPAPMTFISWSLMWQASFGILLSFFASHFWTYNSSNLKLISIPLLSLSFLISPNSAFSYFGFFIAIMILSKTETAIVLKKFLNVIKLFIISGLLASISVYINVYFYGLELNQRASLVQKTELLDKLIWLVSRPLAVSSRFFDISSPGRLNAIFVMVLVVIVITAGLISQSKSSKKDGTLRVIIFFACSILTVTPIAITSSNQIEFRYILGISWCFFMVFSFFIVENLKGHGGISKSVVAILLFTGATTVSLNFERQFLGPYNSKVRYLTSQIQKCEKSSERLTGIAIIPPRAPFPVRQNLGMFSQVTDLASPWVPVPSVQAILAVLVHREVEVILKDKRDSSLDNICVIDLEEYRRQLIFQ